MRKIDCIDRAHLLDALEDSCVPFSEWSNNPRTKTVDHLWDSVLRGEIWLEPRGTEIVAHTYVSVVHVLYFDEKQDRWFELKEIAVECRDGTVMTRDFTGSLGEKIRSYENSRIAAQRGIAEELGYTEPRFMNPRNYILTRRLDMVLQGPQGSEYWPGIQALFHRHIFVCYIPPELFHNEYRAPDDDKLLHFRWHPVT